jgi:biofilm PGA synthesis N-glycosyltransferase PgaC
VPVDRADLPVFLDTTGARWRTVKRSVVLVVVVAAAVLGWFLPRALVPDPGDDPTVRRADTSLLDSLNQHLPVVGRGEMLRVFRADYVGSQPYAVDPFTGERWRKLTQAEMQTVGYSRYAVDRFAELPARQLALTFDDGPDPRYTPALLDLLSRYGARATFFDIGENVLRYPDLFRRTIREGHLVGNHTYSHVDFADHDSAKNVEEIVIADRVMRSVGGYGTRFFRLPYGGNDRASVSTSSYGILLAQQTGHYAASFDIDTNDWQYHRRHPYAQPFGEGGQRQPGRAALVRQGSGRRHHPVGGEPCPRHTCARTRPPRVRPARGPRPAGSARRRRAGARSRRRPASRR